MLGHASALSLARLTARLAVQDTMHGHTDQLTAWNGTAHGLDRLNIRLGALLILAHCSAALGSLASVARCVPAGAAEAPVLQACTAQCRYGTASRATAVAEARTATASGGSEIMLVCSWPNNLSRMNSPRNRTRVGPSHAADGHASCCCRIKLLWLLRLLRLSLHRLRR